MTSSRIDPSGWIQRLSRLPIFRLHFVWGSVKFLPAPVRRRTDRRCPRGARPRRRQYGAGGRVRGDLPAGAQLPTVRQLAVDLSVNPNTVIKAYKELEIRGNLETQQGTGTFISSAPVHISADERRRIIAGLCRDLVGRAGAYGIGLDEVIDALGNFKEER